MGTGKKDVPSVETIHGDAKGQYAKGLESSDNNGVASAKPRVITGSDDATAHKAPPGQKPVGKEWDVNSEDREIKDGEFRG
ncbi:hypothetical protein OIU34_33340 [Pararhizobium sp. BT-229]|uniref:hypothetical protein n=1 Tax=Pararhizobium sp. BT-229 TaxID=2986923 RepID=UPI0021F6E4F3|nr:hypothetical protein [Pararhizobium sp. BT-229]MCV9966761.1 hypothetical protein [Pararhizobium sp. BT-229]